MGTVFRARHEHTGQQVALKTVRGEHASIDSIRREIHTLQRVRHPGIVRLLDEGLHEGIPWYAMELLDGETLRALLSRCWSPYRMSGDADAASSTHTGVPATPGPNAAQVADRTETFSESASGLPHPEGPLPQAQSNVSFVEASGGPIPFSGGARARPPAAGGHLLELLSVARQLSQTLAYLHGEGILHRDLKPDNIVLLEGLRPVLVDFGIVRRLAEATGREALEMGLRTAGTARYMAPEQILGAELDARTDLYGLGCILFEMVCGHPPFRSVEDEPVWRQHLLRAPRRPSELVEGVPPALDDLILRLLAKAPHERPGYADDVEKELEALGADDRTEYRFPVKTYLYRPKFCGRGDVLSALHAEVARAQVGQGRGVLLMGPSGSGKTRLAVELARGIPLSVRILSAEYSSLGSEPRGVAGGQPLQAFRSLLQAVAEHCRRGGPRVTARMLGAHCQVLAEYEPTLAEVPGFDTHPPPPALPGERALERAQRAMVEVLVEFARITPLLLVVDDIQWADEPSLAVLQAIANGVSGPLYATVLMMARSEAPSAQLDRLRAAPGGLLLGLERLQPEEVGRLVAGMIAHAEPPAAVVRVLSEQSSGNPLFIAEYLKVAVTEQLLVREGRHWRFQDDAAALLVETAPESLARLVQGLILRRMEGLTSAARLLSQAGAVIGREWDARQTARAAGLPEKEWPDALDELLQRQVVEESATGGLRFVHDGIREACYAAIAERPRRELHRRVAELFEPRGGEPVICTALAHHFRQAGVEDKAFIWSLRAGEQALASGSCREAHLHFAAALELEAARPENVSRLERARLRRMDAEALSALGDHEASRERCLSTLVMAGVWVPRSGAAQLVNALTQGGRLLARWLVPSTVGAARRQQLPLLEEAALATGVLSRYFLGTGDKLGMLYAILLGADVSLRAEAPAPMSQAAGVLGAMVGLMGLRDAAEHYFRLAREAAQQSGDDLARIRLATTEGSYAFLRGDLGAALQVMEPALARSQEIGTAYETEFLQQLMSIVHLLRGDYETSLRHAVQSLESARELGHGHHYRWGLQARASCELELGHHEQALALGLECERAFREAGVLTDRLASLGIIASARLRLGDLDGALRTAEEGRVLSQDFRVSELNVFAFHRHVPEVYLSAWARAAARGESVAHPARCAALGERAFRKYSRSYACGEPHSLRLSARYHELRDEPRKARELMERALRRSSETGIFLPESPRPLPPQPRDDVSCP